MMLPNHSKQLARPARGSELQHHSVTPKRALPVGDCVTSTRLCSCWQEQATDVVTCVRRPRSGSTRLEPHRR